ncbi:MAG: type II toxin-antitoxin system VapC family toxin [Deltaproteobacteria bacterium]|nr:type II toxin-antitoxin system VapC family toxin [Deltaproteobacteria bacterium]
MKGLVDTHVLLWWAADDGRLSAAAREVLSDRTVALFWSTASTWELAIKASLGKVRLPEPLGDYLRTRLVQQGIGILPVAEEHAVAVAQLPLHHRDPFDRMLVAQAMVEGMALITGDPALQTYDVELLW